ncbi:hypothetical protein [Thiothrix sp.]|uniref:hypothetical protein n=1 Tax=Thiothrix sp. TaxID=1032 RepID=UPI0025807C27|nr:hypothetical protein [Thiothrix sp.]
MALLYDVVKGHPGVILGADIHALIETARHSHEDDKIREFVYEKRVLAETMISRPVMKGFKGMIRVEWLFG